MHICFHFQPNYTLHDLSLFPETKVSAEISFGFVVELSDNENVELEWSRQLDRNGKMFYKFETPTNSKKNHVVLWRDFLFIDDGFLQ